MVITKAVDGSEDKQTNIQEIKYAMSQLEEEIRLATFSDEYEKLDSGFLE